MDINGYDRAVSTAVLKHNCGFLKKSVAPKEPIIQYIQIRAGQINNSSVFLK